MGAHRADLTDDIADLSQHLRGPVASERDAEYVAAIGGFDLSVPQRPPVVIGATGRDDVVTAVRFARDRGLPVGVLATGHGVTAPANSGVLVNTRRAQAISVDPDRRVARLQPGVVWGSVVDAAAPSGLAPLCGSAPGVGAVGLTLGGGIGPLSRHHGFAADHVRRLEIVTADGELRDVTVDREPDLFWAARGGGGNFGVVTELEIALMPLSEFYGGNLFFRGEDAGAVLTAFAACASRAPDPLSLSVAIVTFPDRPAVPAPLRGQFRVQARVACAGPRELAEDVIGPLRQAAKVVLDTVGPMPFTAVGTIHNDPTEAMPENVRSLVLREFDAAAIGVILRYAKAGTPFMIELRHLGGALGRPPDVANAVGHRAGLMNLFTSAYPVASRSNADAGQRQLLTELTRWSDGGSLYTFLSGSDLTPADVRQAFAEPDFDRLGRIKAAWDPYNMFRFNANIPASATGPAVARHRRRALVDGRP